MNNTNNQNYAKCGRVFYDANGKVAKIEKDYCGWGVGNNGFIFYDAEAYHTSVDKPCYVPEYSDADDQYYTRQDFLNLCGGDENLANDLFDSVDWQSPETLLAEWEEGDEVEFCDICEVHHKVYNDEDDYEKVFVPKCKKEKNKMEKTTIIQFSFDEVVYTYAPHTYAPMVKVNGELDEDTLNQIEDAISSYDYSIEDWTYGDLIDTVLKSFNLTYEFITPVRTYNI